MKEEIRAQPVYANCPQCRTVEIFASVPEGIDKLKDYKETHTLKCQICHTELTVSEQPISSIFGGRYYFQGAKSDSSTE